MLRRRLRHLLLAARRPFLRVEGVELSETLHATALRNIDVARLAKPDLPPIVARNIDAGSYGMPVEPFVLTLFNPFAAPVIAQVAKLVTAALEERPREAYIVGMFSTQRRRSGPSRAARSPP